MFNVYFYGPLRVLLDAQGEVLAVQDRISQMSAFFTYSEQYIADAVQFAKLADQSLYSEA